MNKAQFIEALSAHYAGNKVEAAKALNAVVQTITYQAAAGEKVSITGFGVFEKVHREARTVRNPRTGERKQAEATAVPRFRAGTDLKAYVSGAKSVPQTTGAQPAAETSATSSGETSAEKEAESATPVRATRAAATKSTVKPPARSRGRKAAARG